VYLDKVESNFLEQREYFKKKSGPLAKLIPQLAPPESYFQNLATRFGTSTNGAALNMLRSFLSGANPKG
jgi:hypothetical protein